MNLRVIRFKTVLKEREDFSNKVQQERIKNITESYVKLSRLFDDEAIHLQTQLSIIAGPRMDLLSEPSEVSEISDKLQMIGISTKRTLAYLLFDHHTN